MKISNDTIGNRTRDLPTCSAGPQPTTLPRIPWVVCKIGKSDPLTPSVQPLKCHNADCFPVQRVTKLTNNNSSTEINILFIVMNIMIPLNFISLEFI